MTSRAVPSFPRSPRGPRGPGPPPRRPPRGPGPPPHFLPFLCVPSALPSDRDCPSGGLLGALPK